MSNDDFTHDAEKNDNIKHGPMKLHKKMLIILVLPVIAVAALLVYLLAPNNYALSGRVVNNFDVPIIDIGLIVGDKKATTDEKGEYRLTGVKKGELIKLEIPSGYSYKNSQVDIKYDAAKQSGIKDYTLQQEIKIEYDVKDFVDQLLTNQKYTRHNLIWSQLDEPSQKVFGNQDEYEKFFKAMFNLAYPQQKLKEYSIHDDKITVRKDWTSPQGKKYTNVFEVPYEYTELNGLSDNSICYVIQVDNKLKVASSYSKNSYSENKNALIDEGYITK